MPGITIVVAMDKNNVIGKNGDIPWGGRLRGDMKHFKTYTMGKTVVMGRKTHDSIPERYRPLPGRRNIVLTRDKSWQAKGCTTKDNPGEILELASTEEVCIIGGGEIYNLFASFADKIILTVVDTTVDNGDTFFPDMLSGWNKRVVAEQEADDSNTFPFTIFEFTR